MNDAFETGTLLSQWYTFSTPSPTSVTVDVTGGTLNIRLPANASSDVNGGVSSEPKDLTDCSVFVQIKALPLPIKDKTYAALSLDLGSPSDAGVSDGGGAAVTYADFSVTADGSVHYLNATTRVDPLGSATTIQKQELTTQAPFWVRLRGAKGTLYWDKSDDGKSWAPFASDPSGLRLTAARPTLVAGTFAQQTDPGFASFDNFDVAP